jgi:hypothetical protein
MTTGGRARVWRASAGARVCAAGLLACHGPSTPSPDAGAGSAAASSAGVPNRWMDCVDILRVDVMRGYRVANLHRFGETDDGSLLTDYRLQDLQPSDLGSFCDWQVCLMTNGYGHACWVNDAGWERCRVCDASADCSGEPMGRADCMAHATDPTMGPCHAGLMQECMIQRALRGPADPRVTQTCQLSAQACAGQLPGDLAGQATAARQETDQVTLQLLTENEAESAGLADASSASSQQDGGAGDGGVPVDEVDATLPDADGSVAPAPDAGGGDL